MGSRLAAVALAHALLALPAFGQPKSAADAGLGLVVSSGYVESKRIASGDQFPIWISFENHSAREIRDLRFVDFRTAGLNVVGPCWRPVTPAARSGPLYPACIPDSSPLTPSPLPVVLAPGQAVTVTGNLIRTAKSGEFMVTGVYSWVDADGGQHRALAPVGPIEVEKDWEDWRTRLREDLPAVLKDVVLPVVKDLAWPLAGFLLGLLYKSGEQKRAAIQQTWNQMLTTSHEIIKGYYMPVSAAANWLLSTFEPGSVNDPDEGFYYLALLFCRSRKVVDEISGFYLKDRLGENLIVTCWDFIFMSFIRSFPGAAGVEAKELLISTISPNETLKEYKKKLSPKPLYDFQFPARTELLLVRTGFDKWTQGDEFKQLTFPILGIFYLAIDYEINRPYDAWYNKPQDFRIYDVLRHEKRLKIWLETQEGKSLSAGQAAQRDSVKEIYALLRKHRRQNTGRRAPKGTRWTVRLWYSLRFRLAQG